MRERGLDIPLSFLPSVRTDCQPLPPTPSPKRRGGEDPSCSPSPLRGGGWGEGLETLSLRQRDGSSGRCGLVDGLDQGDGAASLAAVDGRRAFRRDGPDEVGEL